MCDNGQSSEPGSLSYHVDGINLHPGYIELVTDETTVAGGIHAHLGSFNVGKIAVNAWRGPNYIDNPDTDTAGVGWILCEDWWPYQRPSFVTPPFAGYVSGHSTFSRAAAEVMTLVTGDAFFPGGMGAFVAPQNEFLVFEEGPSVDITLQWATYADASDETSLSRIYGGIHPTADDIPGRCARLRRPNMCMRLLRRRRHCAQGTKNLFQTSAASRQLHRPPAVQIGAALPRP